MEMKTRLIAFVLSMLCLCGCQKQDAGSKVPTHVFTVAAFKPLPGKVPSASELVALKAFALSVYNPHSVPADLPPKTGTLTMRVSGG
jgi:hypothetical protein